MKTFRDVGSCSLDQRARLRRRSFLRAAFATSALLLGARAARAQLLDSVDVQEGEGPASQILVRFTTTVQYLRHTPPHSGTTLRIFLQVLGPGLQPEDLVPTTVQYRGSDRVPRFTVSYPETDNAMVVSFAREVRFSVGPGPDSRSIVIAVTASRD